jgi:hypothetical protein
MMSARLYNEFKAKHDAIKPIRGRKPEWRPIKNRRKTHESIHEVTHNGVKGIACRLYNTDVVTFLQDGKILINTGGWNTQTTQKFISDHSPWSCTKSSNRLWLYVRGTAVPIERDGTSTVLEAGESGFRLVRDKPFQQKVVDRVKAKEARRPLEPFLQWAKTFLALSGNMVAYETHKQVCGVSGQDVWGKEQVNYDFWRRLRTSTGIYEYLCNLHEEDYIKVLCAMFPTSSYFREDVDVTFRQVKDAVYGICNSAADVHKYVEVKLGPKPIANLV